MPERILLQTPALHIMIGERISWLGANRIESGVVEEERTIDLKGKESRKEYVVRLDNGKNMIVPEKSVID